MATTRQLSFGQLAINPALNPGVLDSATWDSTMAWAAVQAVLPAYWQALRNAVYARGPLPASETGLTVHTPSIVWHRGNLIGLAELADGQHVFLAIGQETIDDSLGTPLGVVTQSAGCGHDVPLCVAAYPTDAPIIDRFCRLVAYGKGPQALGPVPRLGVGTRMTTAVWPAIWRAMTAGGFATNAIQNSVRELNLLATLLAGRPAERNVAFGFGAIETGYTGSTFEGLWVAGVLDALKHGPATGVESAPPRGDFRWGADADHIQVKRGPDGLARARQLLDATRYYSFFTLDVSDILDYTALATGPAQATAMLATHVPDALQRHDLRAFHGEARRIGGFDYRPDDVTLGRLVGKYWPALAAAEHMVEQIRALKDGVPFDLELSIDEHPNEIPTFDCLTSNTELIFVLLEAERRGIPLTHVAPNFGVEKGTDYRGADGLPGFAARVRELCRIAQEFGVMPDFHSGDDLSAATRRVIGQTTSGRHHFKVSPNLQLLFGEVLAGYHPELFRRWYADAEAYARREAAAGSTFAAECLRAAQKNGTGDPVKQAHDDVFHHFSFAFVGRRDAHGQFICREEFYDLSPAFYRAHHDRIVDYLLELAEDLRLATK